MTRSGPEKIDSPHTNCPGLEDHEPGHQITSCVASSTYGSGMTATCSCSFEFHFQVRSDGRSTDLRGKRSWAAHLEAVRQPDLITKLGTVIRANFTEQVLVTSTIYALNNAPMPKYAGRGSWAVLLVRSNGKHRIISIQHDRDWVIGRAQAYLRKAELERREVTRTQDGVRPDEPPESAKERSLRLLDMIDAAMASDATLLSIEDALAEASEFLRLAPIVEARRTQLAAERDRRLTSRRTA